MTLPRLYGIADGGFGDPVRLGEALFRGGVELVQLRDKTASSRSLLESARALVDKAPPRVRIIVNDRVDVAVLSGAHGVHVGQTDLSLPDIRRIAPNLMVGLSTHTAVEVADADALDVDYIAFGPIFATRTKADASPVVGCAALASARKRTRLPIVAIGGIGPQHLKSVISAGADAVAVISAVLAAPDPARAAAEIREKLGRVNTN
jgi:thiamine-phosphate pyrophosphorylase